MNQSTAGLRAALMLYPGRYRRERGEELADVFAGTTADAGRLATARELFDLGAYGLRMRTGLTSTSAGGRLAVLAAPLVAGAAAGLATAYAAIEYTQGFPGHLTLHHTHYLLKVLASYAVVGAVLLSAGAAVLGRWTAAKSFAVVSALATATDMALQATDPFFGDLWDFLEQLQWHGPYLLWPLVLLAAPRDALPSPTWRERGLLAASAVLTPVVALTANVYDSTHHLELQSRALMVCVPLLMALTALRGWYVVAVPGLAALPWALSVNLHAMWQQTGGFWRFAPMAVVAVAAMIAVATLGRRRGSSDPAGSNGGDGRLTA
ncbi:hypothetical protein ACWCXH_01000 [Kitasatospora sp. NPDC001660]